MVWNRKYYYYYFFFFPPNNVLIMQEKSYIYNPNARKIIIIKLKSRQILFLILKIPLLKKIEKISEK